MNIIQLIATAFYLLLPAYLANMAPAVFYKIFNRVLALRFLNKPVQQLLFGQNKTWQGIITGTIMATLTSGGQALIYHFPYFQNLSLINYPQDWLLFGFLAGLGAMLGDLLKSFFKRRIKIPPGQSLPLADQLDFIAGFLVFTWWLVQPDLILIITIIALTLILHPLTNIISWAIKIKKYPW